MDTQLARDVTPRWCYQLFGIACAYLDFPSHAEHGTQFFRSGHGHTSLPSQSDIDRFLRIWEASSGSVYGCTDAHRPKPSAV
ncbi:hypothetical protein D9M69_138900 [compost metagenome]